MSTKFSLKDPNPGVWFKFDEDDPDSGEISIRPITAGKLFEIRKATVKKREIYKHNNRFVDEQIDEDKSSRMLWDYIIAEWKGLEDDDGNPIECTAENKHYLMMNNIGFARFVGQCREKIDEDLEGKAEEVEKN